MVNYIFYYKFLTNYINLILIIHSYGNSNIAINHAKWQLITVIETYGVQGQDSHSDHEKKNAHNLISFQYRSFY